MCRASFRIGRAKQHEESGTDRSTSTWGIAASFLLAWGGMVSIAISLLHHEERRTPAILADFPRRHAGSETPARLTARLGNESCACSAASRRNRTSFKLDRRFSPSRHVTPPCVMTRRRLTKRLEQDRRAATRRKAKRCSSPFVPPCGLAGVRVRQADCNKCALLSIFPEQRIISRRSNNIRELLAVVSKRKRAFSRTLEVQGGARRALLEGIQSWWLRSSLPLSA